MAKKSRSKRTVKELKQASLIIQYELNSLYLCYDILQASCVGWSSNDREKGISNAFLHAMLLAARNLLAFLYSHEPRENDIIAEDFFDDPSEWSKRRLVPSPEMDKRVMIGQISKRLAHLTWDRADGTKPLWEDFRIVWNICLVLQSFVELADDARIHGQLRQDVALATKQLQSVLNQHPELNGAMAPGLDSILFDDLAYFGDDNQQADEDDD